MTKKQMQRIQWAAGILIFVHWLITVPFSNVYLQGLWPPMLTEKPHAVWASGVIVVAIALGAVMLWLAHGIRQTVTAAASRASSELRPAYWAILGYGVFVISVAALVATTLDPDIYQAVGTLVYIVALVAGGGFVIAGTLFLRRIRKEHLKTEWNRLFLRDE